VVSAVLGWNDPSHRCALGAAEVHAWLASLDVAPSVAARLARTLADEERTRAARFRNDADQRRFTVARGVLRAIMASYLGVPSSAVRFAAGIHGKPELAPPDSGDAPCRDITFNVAHSGELALYAIARRRQVGVDIERVDATTDIEALGRRFFSEAEQSSLRSLEGQRRRAAIYRSWTHKEAYLKARGVGLLLPLDSLDAGHWTLMDLPVGPDYVAALATEGAPLSVRLWRWRETQ